jgi:hypothetical protein
VVSHSRDDGGSGFILPSSALSVYGTIGCSLDNKGGGNDGISSRSAAASFYLSLSDHCVALDLLEKKKKKQSSTTEKPRYNNKDGVDHFQWTGIHCLSRRRSQNGVH